jgi:Putative Flp pilus-assembly TadE/G-like
MFVHNALLRTVPIGYSMYNLLRCRRGSAAFATVVALVPLIGAVGLGAEVGSWYVTKQHAQNAADTAAISGALRLKCGNDAQKGVPCTDTNSVDYRAKQFAAQNSFCNAGDTSYPGSQCVTTLPTGTSQSVSVDIGTDQVRATASQQQPKYLIAVLPGMSSSPVTISATAVAQIQILTNPCILALTGSVSFQGSVTVSSQNCGIASNSTAPNSFDFTGNGGLSINAPSFAAGGCSQTGGNQCAGVTTRAPKVPDPLAAFNSAMSSVTPSTSSFSGGQCTGPGLPKAYTTATPCYNAGTQNLSGTLSGTYFFSGTVNFPGGNGNLTSGPGGVTLILLNGASLSGGSNNSTITLTAQTNPQVPPALSSVRNLMTDLLIYDPSSSSVDFRGTTNSYYNGTIYAPNAAVSYGGNTSVSAPNPGCFQLIAASVTFFGSAKLDESKCKADGAPTPEVDYVRLVQ